MKDELILQITKIDDFLTPFDLNSSEEILFTLIQLINIRDEREVSDATLDRVLAKANQKQLLLMDTDKFVEEYFVSIGTFIGGFMQFFFEGMEGDPEKFKKDMKELTTFLGKKISSKEITSLHPELVSRLQLIQKNSVLIAEPMVEKMIKGTFSKKSEEKLLKAQGDEFSSFIITISLSLLAIIQEKQEETGWNIDSSIEPQESLSEIEGTLREVLEGSTLCDDATFEYSLGDKPICNLCQKEYKGIKRHLNSCIDKKFEQGKKKLYYLIIESDPKQYYLHISIQANATLEDLDAYIREVWVECCGHMSDFSIRGGKPLSMDTSIKKIFSSSKKLGYIYDYGTATYLNIELVKEFKGKQETILKTLARNPHIKVICERCKNSEAVAVCSQCLWNTDEAYLCSNCMPKHECDMDMFLPYVNSPRVGECAYGNWEDVKGLSSKEQKKFKEELEW
jgi:dihydroxyacetone kinase DhaKLM complex PTS-EIIA-like component DhaM